MKHLTTLAAMAAVLGGCANGYAEFYQPNTSPGVAQDAILFAGVPQVRASTGDARQDIDIMYTDGYGAVGAATFNGPMNNIGGAIAQAKKVGASVVVANRRYTDTLSGVLPLTMPTSQTSYSNGTVNAYGSGGFATGTYSGTTTTYGSETTYMPYSVARYDQQAIFFAPIKRVGVGIIPRALTEAEAQALGTRRAVVIRAVRRGSPAYNADILPGDIIRSVNGASVGDYDDFHRGAVNHFVLVRAGQTLEKDVNVPDPW